MKKHLLLLCLVPVLLLCACGNAGEPSDGSRTVRVYGETYIVNDEEGTISDGSYEYSFTVTRDRKVTFTYPDGSTYWWQQDDNLSYGGWSDSYEQKDAAYADGDKLYSALTAESEKVRAGGANPAVVFFLLAIGLWGAAAPRSLWYVEYGWHFKDAEPSELALGLNRVGGIICLVIGLIVLAGLVF